MKCKNCGREYNDCNGRCVAELTPRRILAAYHNVRPEYQSPDVDVFTVVCDDGTVWERRHRKAFGNLEGWASWHQVDTVPPR